METSDKQSAEKHSNYQQHTAKIKGFCFYRETVCGYSTCICTTAHYHCQSCGYGTSELPHVMSHKDSCSGCIVGSNYGRSYSQSSRSQLQNLQNVNSSQGMERPQIYSSPYGAGSDSGISTSVAPTACTLPNNNGGSGGHFFHRGLQQSPVFNPLLSSQGQSLYNGVFSTQTSYTSQNTFTSTSFNSYSHVEPWISDTRVSNAMSNALQQVDSDRNIRTQYSDKGMSCSGQSLSHTCCGNRITVPDSVGMCSPLSTEAYRSVNKDLTNAQCKNNSLDSQAWFCNQAMLSYGNQQNQNSSQNNYKCNEQFPSCSVSQLNMLLQEQTDMKHSSDSNITESCFDHAQNHNPGTNKQISHCSSNNQMKSACLEQNKEQGMKYCNLQKIQQNGQSVEHASTAVPQKQQEQNGYPTHSTMYSSSGELHEESLYSQASLILHMGSDSSHNTARFQQHFTTSKHHSLPQNNLADINKSYAISPGQLPVLSHFQEHGRCGLDSGIPCDVMESCLQTDIKTVNENSVNLQSSVSSNSGCCQMSMEGSNSLNHNGQTMFNSQLQQQRSTVNCLPNCGSVGEGMQLCADGDAQELQIDCAEADGKENSNQESSSVAGESDIIVEETEEEMTESEISIEEIKSTVFREEEPARCLVCSMSASGQASDNQFIHMRGDSPVTSASHIPVVTKLAQVVTDGHTQILKLHNEFICRRCLSLIDTVDCLETKLAAVKQDLIQLFETRLISLKALENWKVGNDITEKIVEEPEDNADISLPKSVPDNPPEHTQIESLDKDIDNSAGSEVKDTICEEKISSADFDEKIETENENHDATSDKEKADSGNVSESSVSCETQVEIEVSPNSKYQCDVCTKSFASKEYLQKHHQQHHTKQFSFYCDRCGKGFTLLHALENHLLLHSGEYRFQCEICGKLFIQRYSLDDHLRKHEGRYRLSCQQCGKGFMCRNSLHVHMRTHTGERPFVCQHCGKRFSSSSNLVAHIRVCSGDLPFQCSQCSKRFALVTQLKVHVSSRHEGQYPFKCTICGKGFTKDSDRKVHARSHSGEKPHKCDVCGKSYSSLGNLNQHAKQHGGERPFKCLVCGEGFLRRSTLSAHMNHHTGARPYSCDQCSKTFNAKRNLYAHRKWHAGTIKRHTCTVCGKSFNHGLQVHMRTHSGDKPYPCSECDMAFTVRSTLNKHVKSKHQKIIQFEKQS
ncbi:uncharacterized protein [Periplaneta americana]|uniref:uncharacterized protein n=1 Tax=Periplaneta americana TaxID=6978 RepID=UPI0037E8FD03